MKKESSLDIEKEVISQYRVISFGIILVCLFAFSSFYCLMKQHIIDVWICGFAIDILFFLAVLYQMEFERKRVRVSNNIETTFLRIACGVAICTVFSAVCILIPDFYSPVILLPIIMYALANASISITFSIYFVVGMCVLANKSIYEFALYVCLIAFGIIWVKALEEEKLRIWASILLALVSVFMPVLFVFYNNRSITLMNIAYAVVSGIVVFIVCFYIFRKIRYNTVHEIDNRYDDLLDTDFPEVKELKVYSRLEFTHALLVSKLSFLTAKELGLESKLCAAAGFYYRLGRWKGEPHVQVGIDYAKKLSFPLPLITILSEYNGEEKLPSTKESALVHMIDAVVKKIQVLNKSTTSSEWNLEMLVYQTMNELSQSGIYDESGLTMNQFLKIRNFLVKEEILNEFLS